MLWSLVSYINKVHKPCDEKTSMLPFTFLTLRARPGASVDAAVACDAAATPAVLALVLAICP